MDLNCRQTLNKHKKATKGMDWQNQKKIEIECTMINLKSIGPTFFKFMPIFMKVFLVMFGNYPSLICGQEYFKRCLLNPPLLTKINRINVTYM